MTQSITSGQQKQYKGLVEDAAEKALAEVQPDRDRLQKLIENGDEFQADIIALVEKHLLGNQFAGEEIESSFIYRSGYKPKGITEQTNILRRLFPGIGFVDEKIAEQQLPPRAEGWFAIPRWQSVAKTYNEAVQKALDLIKEQCKGKFCNQREGKLGEQNLRQHKLTLEKLEELGEQQKGYDILVVAAQFGFRHRGRSVRRTREVFTGNEFGLGAFEIGCMILTHPERLQEVDALWINCAGDEYAAPDGDGDFLQSPCFEFCRGVKFDSLFVCHVHGGRGSASGFLSQ